MTGHDTDDSVVRHGVRNTASRVSVKGLLLANAVPVVGIVVFGWNPHLLLVSYWLETAVVVVTSIVKARRAEGADDPAELPTETFNDTSTESLIGQSKREITTHFGYCYSSFWVMYTPFVFLFPVAVASMELASPTAIGVAALSLVAQHAVSYWATYIGEREYERQGPVTVMFEPYQRVIVLHVTIVLGGFILPLIGSGVSLLVVRVLVETYFDRWGLWKVHDPAWRRVTCPECDKTVEQTAAHCMYCSADLIADRESAPIDEDKSGDKTDTAAPTSQEIPSGRRETASKATGMIAETGSAIKDSIGDSSATATEDAGLLLSPDGLVDNTLTALVGIVGGIIVGAVGTTVLVLMTGSIWAVAVGVGSWLGATAYLSRRRTVQAAIAKTGYAVALVLLVVPVVALSPGLSIEGGSRGGLFLVMLIFAGVPAGIAAGIGWVASQFVPEGASDGEG